MRNDFLKPYRSIFTLHSNYPARVRYLRGQTRYSIGSSRFKLLDFRADRVEGPDLHGLRPGRINSSKTPQRAGRVRPQPGYRSARSQYSVWRKNRADKPGDWRSAGYLARAGTDWKVPLRAHPSGCVFAARPAHALFRRERAVQDHRRRT